MDDEVFEDYDRELELALYREYRDVVSQFQYVIETERRFYLANEVNVVRRDTEHDFYFEITMTDVWVWDIYRADRFVKSVRVLTFKDVNVEELSRRDFHLPEELRWTPEPSTQPGGRQNSVGEPMNDHDARWCAADAVLEDRVAVVGARVALVARPVVRGQLVVQLGHERVARDLRDDGCRGRTRAVAVGLDHRADRQAGAARRRDVVVVAVEHDDRVLGDDAVRAQVGEGADRGEPEGAHDADLVDLDGTGPSHRAGGHPGCRARGDLGASVLGHELRIAQALRDPLARARRVDHDGAHRDGTGESASSDLVARDQDRVLSQQAPLERQTVGSSRRSFRGGLLVGFGNAGEHLVVEVQQPEAVERPGGQERASDDIVDRGRSPCRAGPGCSASPSTSSGCRRAPTGCSRARRHRNRRRMRGCPAVGSLR